MNDSMYRAGGNDPLNLPIGSAQYRKQWLIDGRTFDAQNGIPSSQWGKHIIPNWILILACLPPNDTDETRTIEEIQSIITDLEWPIPLKALNNAFGPMVSKNPKKQAQMSKVIRETLLLVNGIHRTKVVEDGVCMGSYTLGITSRKLQELVNKKQFVTYSFNLNESNAVRLLGGK
jgi:hypothetical protein